MKRSKIDFSVKNVIVLMLVCLLSSCAWFAGGADYTYSYTASDGTETKIKVHSVREVESGVKLTIAPDGVVSIETGPLVSGVNNMGQALGIIDGLVKASALAATP